ncbi:hypothetical protein [Kitasatospora viridis]|uniref:Uncharacterized protein n=1 Tax=Kitasatospora viridis TaxID=281105 RepID=A0A561SFH1_9ACTN|nr:hypothetical protein [Kitasatospora viridis]TWF73609.1 hypothetical protein FHX73_15222 [Kitasatospora viridis]
MPEPQPSPERPEPDHPQADLPQDPPEPDPGDRPDGEPSEQDRAATRFRDLAHDPLFAEAEQDGPGDLAAAARAHREARASLGVGGDWNSFENARFERATVGGHHQYFFATRQSAAVTGGPVPEAELRRVRTVYREPEGYVELRRALRAQRVVVLGGAPGTGRTCTALALLDEVTGRPGWPTGTDRVLRVDPALDLAALTELVTGAEQREHLGHLLELPAHADLTGHQEFQLDALSAALRKRDSYAMVVVSGAGTRPAGRYGRLCPPAPTDQVLRARLAEQLTESPELLRSAEQLAELPELREAIGLERLRPVEAEHLADRIAGHLLGARSRDELLADCRELARQQAHEWFAAVDQELAAPGDAAGLLHPAATRIALAVLNGAPHSTVTEAAHLLTWELALARSPETPPARPLFCDDPIRDLALLRAELADGEVAAAGLTVPARLVRYQGRALPAAVLTEVWERHHAARPPVVRWLRMLADDPRPHLWIRAAIAAGELCARDFSYGYQELVRPLAGADTPRRRVFAALALDQAARHPSHRAVVHRLVHDWAAGDLDRLRWTAAVALGYGNAAGSVRQALDALGRIGTRREGAQAAIAAVNVVRLLAGGEDAAVLRRIGEWTGRRQAAYQDLGLLCVVKLASTELSEVWDDQAAPELAPAQSLPLPLALALLRPDRARPLAELLWTALNTPRSAEAATEVLQDWLDAAAEELAAAGEPAPDGPTVLAGLAALLPPLLTDQRDRRRLDWLLRRMMNDPDDPLPKDRAQQLWRAATTGTTRPDPGAAHRGGEPDARG